MQKKVLIPLIILIVLVAGGTAAYVMNVKISGNKEPDSTLQIDSAENVPGLNKQKSNDGANSTSPSTNSKQGGASSTSGSVSNNSAPVSTTNIAIKDMAFSPAATTIKKGAALTWTNQDSAAHAIAMADGAAGPHSPQLKTGESYTYTFTQAGTYKYFDAVNPDITATVTVTE